MPHQALALLANSRFQLPKEVPIVAQPLAGHTLAAAINPLRLVFATEVFQVPQLAVGQVDLPLEVPQTLGGRLLGLFGHVHHRRQARLRTLKPVTAKSMIFAPWLASHDPNALLSLARDLISVGAYVPGGDRETDTAIALQPAMVAYLRQGLNDNISQGRKRK